MRACHGQKKNEVNVFPIYLTTSNCSRPFNVSHARSTRSKAISPGATFTIACTAHTMGENVPWLFTVADCRQCHCNISMQPDGARVCGLPWRHM